MFDQSKYITLSVRQNALEKMVKRDKHTNLTHLQALQENSHELLAQLIEMKEENNHGEEN